MGVGDGGRYKDYLGHGSLGRRGDSDVGKGGEGFH